MPRPHLPHGAPAFPRIASALALRLATLVLAALSVALSLAPTPLAAFPPAPFHTIYGMIRDENGQTLRVEGAQVIFYRSGTEVLRETIQEGRLLDQNYQIRLRMDMLRPGTRTYTGVAHNSGSAFSIGILLHDVVYYPIEMSVTRNVGQPGQRTRLDLTLGVDSDGDGIPDAWEQSQLYAAGYYPVDDTWDLSLLDRDGDFDRDGLSNYQEYIAGTFATDATDYLALRLIEATGAHAQLSFFSIYGKVYSVESSTDLQTWTAAPLYLTDPDATSEDPQVVLPTPVSQASLQATSTAIINIYAATAASGTRNFYRLKVR